MRTFDPALVSAAISGMDENFTVSDWLENSNNIALTNDKGDVSLFEHEQEGVYQGHFFYHSRGKEAVKTANKMLREIFAYPFVKILIGLTPVDKLGAKWLSRKIGFKSYGEIETLPGRCELFILTRKDYERGQH